MFGLWCDLRRLEHRNYMAYFKVWVYLRFSKNPVEEIGLNLPPHIKKSISSILLVLGRTLG